MDPRRANLGRLFAPTSIAVVGASASPEKVGYQALLALGSFPGEVFAVNPRADEILGRRAWPSLRSLAHPVDLVIFALPAAACVDAVGEAIDCQCGGGLVLSGGFAESGPEGGRLQAELEKLCQGSHFRLLGPNTAGFVNKAVSLTASFVPSADCIPPGDIAVVAQSAGINLTVSFLLAKLGYGVSCAIGLGNAIDVDAADALEFVAEQPETKAIALHLEGVRLGRRLYDVLRRVTPKKPVAVLTVGREDVGEFARSHTGNLIGSYTLRTSALRQAGAVIVESTEELAAAAGVLSRYRLPPKEHAGVGVLTAQAGPGLVMLDLLKSSGVSVPTLAAPTLTRIAEHLPPRTYSKNPVDTGRPGESFTDILVALADDPGIDVIVAYALHEPAALRPERALPVAAKKTEKPLLFGTMGPREEIAPVLTTLRTQGFYVAESPEELARAAVTLARDAALQTRVARQDEPRPSAFGKTLPRATDEHAAKGILDVLGVPTPRRIVCASHEEAHDALGQLAKPVVVKILSAEVAHKTEVGGVHLNVTERAQLGQALERLDVIPLGSARRYLLEEMAPPGLEIILGVSRDPSFGPVVMVGLGGTLAEALRDTALRLAPLALRDAQAMVAELRASTLLDGWRGSPKLDRDALARVIVVLGDFAHHHPSVRQFEINPLRVYPSGVLALDALLELTTDAEAVSRS
jgi:acyl-CoA synthetase (NDP forming)